MADDQRGNFGKPEEHAQAGKQSSGNKSAANNLDYKDRSKGGKATAAKTDMTERGREGGFAAQQSGNAHELTDEERSEGGSH